MLQNKVVKMTAEQLFREHMTGLEQLSRTPLTGKLAYGVMKNFQFASRVAKKAELDRISLLRKYAVLDKDGGFVLDKSEGAPAGKCTFPDAEKEKEFQIELSAMMANKLYEVPVHMISQDLIPEMQSIQPAILMMTECIWQGAPDGEPDPNPEQEAAPNTEKN